MQFRKATRQKAKIRLGISGPSGSGKTVAALLIAYGMTGDWGKIGVIDTENKSADLYANHKLPGGFKIGQFEVLTLSAPYSPERYVEAMQAGFAAGFEVLILDSASHEWDGKGGCLEINELLASTKFRGNTWAAWSETTPRHQNFINTITTAPVHLITTARSKTDTIQTEDKKVKKIGLKEIQREGFEYELTLNFNIDRDGHYAVASKDRTGLFSDVDPFVITENTGRHIADWCENGEDVDAQVTVAINKLSLCESQDEILMLRDSLPDYIRNNADFRNAGNARYAALKPADNRQPETQSLTVEDNQSGETKALASVDTPTESSADDQLPAAQPEQPSIEIDPAALKDQIISAETPDQLSELFNTVDGLDGDVRKSLRITITTKAKKMGWVPNAETKRFEASVRATDPVEGNRQEDKDAGMMQTILSSTSREDLLMIYKANMAQIQTSPELSDAYQKRRDALAPAEDETILARINGATALEDLTALATEKGPVIERYEQLNTAFNTKIAELRAAVDAATPAASGADKDAAAADGNKDLQWFTDRIGKSVWMQGRDPEQHFTGPYLVENEAFPQSMHDWQATGDFTFRDLTPEEAAA